MVISSPLSTPALKMNSTSAVRSLAGGHLGLEAAGAAASPSPASFPFLAFCAHHSNHF